MKIKKVRKAGECAVMRCKNPAADLMCEKHESAWREAGSPALESESKPGSLLPVEVQAELTEERGTLHSAIQLAQNMPLETQEDVDEAGAMLGMAQARKKELEEQRKSVTGPLNEAVKTINSWFRPLTESCDSVVSIIKKRVADRLAAAVMAQDEALERIEAAGGKADAADLLVAHNTPSAPQNMTIKKVLVGRVVDFALLPDRFKEVNASALKNAVLAGETDIPGVVIEEQDQVIGRSV